MEYNNFKFSTKKIKGEVLENFSQEKDEKELLLQDSLNNNTDDIQFEEVLNLDEIQKKLQARIYENDAEIVSSQDVNTMLDENTSQEKKSSKKLNTAISTNSKSKKYVIYIDPDNIDYMENLSIDERKDVINNVLKEQSKLTTQTRILNTRKKVIKQTILACFTFIIGFPVMFIIVNKSMEASMNNYQKAKTNITKLYKSNGKIKLNEPDAIKDIKY